MNIPERSRFIGDEDPLELWWFVSNALVNFGAGYTFSLKVATISDPATTLFTKTTGFTGSAGSGTESTGTPNLTVAFATTGELNDLDPGRYFLEITATKVSDSTETTLRMKLEMLSRLGI